MRYDQTYKLIILLSVLGLAMLESCSVVKGIFNAGVGVGIFIVVAILALIIFFISKAGGSK